MLFATAQLNSIMQESEVDAGDDDEMITMSMNSAQW